MEEKIDPPLSGDCSNGKITPISTNKWYKDPILSLHHACQRGTIEEVEHFLATTDDINAVDYLGQTPLHHALSRKKIEIAKSLLLDRRINVNARETTKGNTPLIEACEKGDVDFIRLFLDHGANVNMQNNRGDTPLYHACLSEQWEVIELLLGRDANVNLATNYKETPLHIACEKVDFDMVKLLLERGANVNAQDSYGFTPFSITCHEKQLEVAKLLLDKGANVNPTDITRKTPLHTACRREVIPVVQFLLDNNADVNIRDINGETPLHDACLHENKNIVELLINKRADINAVNSRGQTPLHVYCSNIDIRGGDINVAKLLKSEVNVNISDYNGDKPFKLARQRKSDKLAKFLLVENSSENNGRAKRARQTRASTSRKKR